VGGTRRAGCRRSPEICGVQRSRAWEVPGGARRRNGGFRHGGGGTGWFRDARWRRRRGRDPGTGGQEGGAVGLESRAPGRLGVGVEAGERMERGYASDCTRRGAVFWSRSGKLAVWLPARGEGGFAVPAEEISAPCFALFCATRKIRKDPEHSWRCGSSIALERISGFARSYPAPQALAGLAARRPTKSRNKPMLLEK